MAQNDKKARPARHPTCPSDSLRKLRVLPVLYGRAAVSGDEAIQKRYFKFAVVGTRVPVTAPSFPFLFRTGRHVRTSYRKYC